MHFAPVQRPPFGPTVRAFRTVQPFGGRVHLSATATGTAKGFNQDFASEAVIYASDDVAGAPWAPANVEGFGNKDNTTVFEMAEFDGHLYAGTANPITGGELRSEEHTSELQSLMRISYAVFCLNKKKHKQNKIN